MRKRYSWRIEGEGANNTWATEGFIDLDIGQFPDLLARIMQQSFLALTKGQAVFGNPGKGCDGPYDIQVITIRQEAGE